MINNMHIICTKVQTMNMGSWIKLALLFLRKGTKQIIFVLYLILFLYYLTGIFFLVFLFAFSV